VNPDNHFIHVSAEAMKQSFARRQCTSVRAGPFRLSACSWRRWASQRDDGVGLPDDNLHAPNEKFICRISIGD